MAFILTITFYFWFTTNSSRKSSQYNNQTQETVQNMKKKDSLKSTSDNSLKDITDTRLKKDGSFLGNKTDSTSLSKEIKNKTLEEPNKNKPLAEIILLARQYLAASPKQRESLETRLLAYSGAIEPVIEELRSSGSPMGEVRRGEFGAEHFIAPSLREQYSNDLLYFFVPDNYDPSKPIGLFIFLHGGDANTTRESTARILSRPEENSSSYGLRSFIEKAPFITVVPSAPWNEKCHKRWNLPEADDYITAVIDECRYRFNIDRDHLVLGGHSMGGFGAYHLGQRMPDRFAAILFSAGAWNMADFHCLIGTGIFILHGANDCAPGASPVKSQGTRLHDWTGVSFARAASELLRRDNIEHIYREHKGTHAFSDGGEYLQEFISFATKRRRNPFTQHVVAMTPRGSWLIKPVTATPHLYWVSIEETEIGAIEYDVITLTGPNIAHSEADLQKQSYTLGKAPHQGGRVEANLRVNNLIEVQTEHVRRFSLWLHPNMVDFSQPIIVLVNGKRGEYTVRQSLLTALRSYERQKDWGLIYYAEIIIDKNHGQD
jgi:enterochelin esterase-like enzyme